MPLRIISDDLPEQYQSHFDKSTKQNFKAPHDNELSIDTSDFTPLFRQFSLLKFGVKTLRWIPI